MTNSGLSPVAKCDTSALLGLSVALADEEHAMRCISKIELHFLTSQAGRSITQVQIDAAVN
jgi:hypothetical protein